MGKFVVVYKGGAMAETPEAQEATMQRWMQWFGGLGSSVTDFGNPFGPSVALNHEGVEGDATSELTGYTILEAEDLGAARGLVSDCPVFAAGGSVEIYEAMPM